MKEMRPTSCELCGCAEFRWNLRSHAMAADPPKTCTCGHFAYRHRYRAARADR